MAALNRQQFRAIVRANVLEQLLSLVIKEEEAIDELVRKKAISLFKLYHFGDQLFVYLESNSLHKDVPLPQSINALLGDWPASGGNRKWVEMLDIFHDAMPRTGAPWREPNDARTSIGSIIYLRPEKYASYVYYHFQLQEEGLKKFNKYFIIGAHENCLFSYYELPAVIDSWNDDRILQSNNSPDNWAELMGEHFQPWAEGLNIEDPWKVMQEIYSFPSRNA